MKGFKYKIGVLSIAKNLYHELMFHLPKISLNKTYNKANNTYYS